MSPDRMHLSIEKGMYVMITKQISIFLENRPGALAELCGILEEGNVNMRAMCLAEAEDFGILRIIVDDPLETVTFLKDHGYISRLTDVLTVEIDDRSGALLATLNALFDAEVNIEYSYAFLSKKSDKAYMVLRVAHPEEAAVKLTGSHVNIVSQEELTKIFA